MDELLAVLGNRFRLRLLPPYALMTENASAELRSWSPVSVYGTCMAKVRTNIEIEDDYVRAIMRRYHLRTKTDVVDLALRTLAAEPMTREEALAMRGSHSIDEVPRDQPPRGAAA
ncbi:MAG: type II toxin-antitoxin system VapB family antitoxin [Jiangellaceae bacterium]